MSPHFWVRTPHFWGHEPPFLVPDTPVFGLDTQFLAPDTPFWGCAPIFGGLDTQFLAPNTPFCPLPPNFWGCEPHFWVQTPHFWGREPHFRPHLLGLGQPVKQRRGLTVAPCCPQCPRRPHCPQHRPVQPGGDEWGRQLPQEILQDTYTDRMMDTVTSWGHGDTPGQTDTVTK